jgi:phytoene dehydrogenase-like protein
MKTYDAIVVGAGHNGLTAAAFLAKAGLDVVCVEKNDYIGGAAVSRNLYKDWWYSNCSYVCSLLRPEIYRALELHKHGLQVTPYGGSVTFMENGDYYGSYHDHEVAYREMARFSRHDADAYKTYSADTMRQCRFIRDFLLSTAPDPTSFRPGDIRELIRIGGKFMDMGEDRMYETIRFWTMSVAEYLDEYFETDVIKAAFSGSGIIGTALGIHSPGTAYVLLHHYMGDVDGNVGSWGFARGGMGSVSKSIAGAFQAAGGELRTEAGVDQIIVKNGKTAGVALENGDELSARVVVSAMDVKRTFLTCMDKKDLPAAFHKRVENFKIRGSSGKVNIALDGMPTFPALPEGSSLYHSDMHFIDSMERMERAYLHELLRSILPVSDRGPRLDERRKGCIWSIGHRADCQLQPGLQGPDPACRNQDPAGHRGRDRHYRRQYLPRRTDDGSAPVQQAGTGLRAVPRASGRALHVWIEYPPGRWRDGRAGSQRRERNTFRSEAAEHDTGEFWR